MGKKLLNKRLWWSIVKTSRDFNLLEKWKENLNGSTPEPERMIDYVLSENLVEEKGVLWSIHGVENTLIP